jgi:hypothetical protein
MNTPAPDYGEPWALDPADGFWNKVADKDGKTVAGLAATRRAIACVNACAGMADPAAEIASLNDTLESAIELIRRVSTGPATPNDAWEWLKQHNLDKYEHIKR